MWIGCGKTKPAGEGDPVGGDDPVPTATPTPPATTTGSSTAESKDVYFGEKYAELENSGEINPEYAEGTTYAYMRLNMNVVATSQPAADKGEIQGSFRVFTPDGKAKKDPMSDSGAGIAYDDIHTGDVTETSFVLQATGFGEDEESKQGDSPTALTMTMKEGAAAFEGKANIPGDTLYGFLQSPALMLHEANDTNEMYLPEGKFALAPAVVPVVAEFEGDTPGAEDVQSIKLQLQGLEKVKIWAPMAGDSMASMRPTGCKLSVEMKPGNAELGAYKVEIGFDPKAGEIDLPGIAVKASGNPAVKAVLAKLPSARSEATVIRCFTSVVKGSGVGTLKLTSGEGDDATESEAPVYYTSFTTTTIPGLAVEYVGADAVAAAAAAAATAGGDQAASADAEEESTEE